MTIFLDFYWASLMKIAFVIFAFMFILLRPYVIVGSGFWYYGDDQDYFAHASSITFGQFPSYKKEYLTIDQQYPQSSIGCGLLALPFVWGFSFIDRLFGSDIVDHRTTSNITGSWTQFGFAFASCFYFSLACFLLYRGTLYYVRERYALLSVVLTVLCQGIPLFAVRRPIFSHAAEFFLQSLFVFLILRNSVLNKKYPHSLGQYLILGLLGALVFLTRYNNIGFSVIAPLMVILSAGFSVRSPKSWLGIISLLAVFSIMIDVFKIWPEAYNHKHMYQWARDFLLINTSLSDLWQRIGHIFFGLDWGLVYTAPYILLGSIALFVYKFPAKKYLLWLLTVLAVNFYIIVVWGSQGGWYGYRYFIASAIPLFVLPVAVLIRNIEEGVKRRLTFIWALIALPPALSMICFEGNNTNLDLYATVQDFGRSDITNNFYQFHVWETFLFHPLQFMAILYKGGVEYLQFIFVHLCQAIGLFPNAFFRLYSGFDPSVLIKVILIYAIPFITAGLLTKMTKDQ